MVQKPKIQYVGQFYVHGSEARALQLEQEKKKARTKLPLAQLEKIEKIYVDPVALIGIVVSVVMLITMAVGALQIQEDWEEYERVSAYVSQLKKENAQLTSSYRAGYDLEDIRVKATAMGMVPKSEVETMTVAVALPEPEPVRSWADEVVWFWNGLWEE